MIADSEMGGQNQFANKMKIEDYQIMFLNSEIKGP